MFTNSETGHAKNAATFKEMVSYVSSYGTMYNPTNALLQVPALQKLSDDCRKILAELNRFLADSGNAKAARDVAFTPLSRIVTRIMNALKAISTSAQVDDNARTLARKIQGRRASAKKTEEEKQALAAEGNEIKENSSSQMSFDSRLENFDKMIKLLSSLPLYNPNEEDLKFTSLISLYNDLVEKNNAVVNAQVSLSNVRIARNNILYNESDGMIYLAGAVKAYLKSVFGASSPQYRQVSGLTFRPLRK